VSRPRTAGTSRGAGELRIIGGEWRRRRLAIADVEGLRPTPDRVRETLFNWLGQHLDGLRCLDLFAGTGALGLEAASRGAAAVLMLERDAHAARQLQSNCQVLGAGPVVQVLQTDALHWLGSRPTADPQERFDVVFLDPPYALDTLQRCLDALPPLLADGARIYLEDDAPLVAPNGWTLLRHDRAGRVFYGLLTCTPHASASFTPVPSIP